MGKIGDLFVRLGLKSDEFKKGMNDAQKQTEGFGGKLGKMKAVAVAAWAAVGAAAMKFAKDVIASTNRTADAWDMFIAKSKAGWTSFLQTVSSWDWDGWIGRIKEATRAAEQLQSAIAAFCNSIEFFISKEASRADCNSSAALVASLILPIQLSQFHEESV